MTSIFSTNFDRGDFRIIDGEKIVSRVRRLLVGPGQALVVGAGGSTPILGLVNFDLFSFNGVY